VVAVQARKHEYGKACKHAMISEGRRGRREKAGCVLTSKHRSGYRACVFAGLRAMWCRGHTGMASEKGAIFGFFGGGYESVHSQ
jgi:hypothetical protein